MEIERSPEFHQFAQMWFDPRAVRDALRLFLDEQAVLDFLTSGVINEEGAFRVGAEFINSNFRHEAEMFVTQVLDDPKIVHDLSSPEGMLRVSTSAGKLVLTKIMFDG
jgi:hypothetical protein